MLGGSLDEVEQCDQHEHADAQHIDEVHETLVEIHDDDTTRLRMHTNAHTNHTTKPQQTHKRRRAGVSELVIRAEE